MEPNGDGGWRLPTEKEVEVAEILLNLPKLWQKSELATRYDFTWGRKKKRSVLPESPSPAPAKPDHTTPPCFLPSDGEVIKAADGDDYMNRMQQEKEIRMKKMTTQHQQLVKAKGKVKNYDEQRRFHQQITMFAPPPPQYCLPQLVMNNNVLRVKSATAAINKRRVSKMKDNARSILCCP